MSVKVDKSKNSYSYETWNPEVLKALINNFYESPNDWHSEPQKLWVTKLSQAEMVIFTV